METPENEEQVLSQKTTRPSLPAKMEPAERAKRLAQELVSSETTYVAGLKSLNDAFYLRLLGMVTVKKQVHNCLCVHLCS